MTPKISVFIATSLDGYIARPDGAHPVKARLGHMLFWVVALVLIARTAIKLIANWRAKRWLLRAMVMAACLLSAGTPAHADRPWRGVVTYTVDGDTLWVRPASGGKPRKIRLDGVDAPEICQRGGAASREALKQRLLGQTVTVSIRRYDDYGRALARIDLRGQDVGGQMVANGHAWSYRFRRNPGPYAAQQAQAQAAGRGLFAHGGAENPRAFRKRHGSCHA